MIQGAVMNMYQAHDILYDQSAQLNLCGVGLRIFYSFLVLFATGLGKTSLFKLAKLVKLKDC